MQLQHFSLKYAKITYFPHVKYILFTSYGEWHKMDLKAANKKICNFCSKIQSFDWNVEIFHLFLKLSYCLSKENKKIS